MMKAEIVAIGTELVSGQNLDTNSAWLSSRLASLGIETGRVSAVGDDLADNLRLFRDALRRSDLIISTGGLGPTQDDLTREVVAEIAGVPLLLDETAVADIQAFFARRQRAMPDRNQVQALIPRGGEAIFNRNGTAPGIWKAVGGALIVCLPGVPEEMKAMFDERVAPRLRGLSGGRVWLQRKINLFGKGESDIEASALDLTARGRTPEVGITASGSIISFRIRSQGANEAEAAASIAETAKTIGERYGELIVGEEGEGLAHAVFALLRRRKATLAAAESCTGGLVSAWLTDLPGVSDSFLGGVVSYSNQAKMDLLGVPEAVLQAHGAVSPETACAMAEGARRQLKTDLAVSITGIAGPGGGSLEKPVGLVYLGLATAQGSASRKLLLGSDFSRELIRDRSAKHALNWVRLHLLRSEDHRRHPENE